jgi:hypothetical protein
MKYWSVCNMDYNTTKSFKLQYLFKKHHSTRFYVQFPVIQAQYLKMKLLWHTGLLWKSVLQYYFLKTSILQNSKWFS